MIATKVPPSTYKQLRAACLPLMTHNKTDLLVHDRRGIRHNPATPFLHWTRQLGTSTVFLIGADEYPVSGTRVPFLFGTADRESLLDNVVEYAKSRVGPSASTSLIVHHFDGKTLRIIDCERAVKIAKQYADHILTMWDRHHCAPVGEWTSPWKAGV